MPLGVKILHLGDMWHDPYNPLQHLKNKSNSLAWIDQNNFTSWGNDMATISLTNVDKINF
jgi:hypothetical protein